MKSVQNILKDLLNKSVTITERISDTYIKNFITTEFRTQMDSGGTIDKCLIERTSTNLPPKLGLNASQTKISYKLDSNSPLRVVFNPQPVYLGGYSSEIKRASLLVPPNATTYIYLARNKTEYGVIEYEQYDRLLGGDDKDIHFSRVLVMRVKANSEKITEVYCYDVGNY